MTTLRVLSAPSVLAAVGGAWAIMVETRDANGLRSNAVAPTVAATAPDGSASSPVPTDLDGCGTWLAMVPLATPGRWLAHVSTPEDALDVAAYAAGPTSASGMPNVDDVAHYLKASAASWALDELQDALDAERGAQRDRCGERAYYPDALRQALLRRVARNLAMRRLPLAVNVGDADGGATILPGRDPEVRRLEAPYRRMPIG